ncbi:phytanoyl-CoA dioxygenase domain-containing protein 1 homolog [Littorina saxatilis]|uniref:Phytanoyl-CoA dioxygenase n=1 Tax=Littorina saxatilis TaxID=31220 RepID=A0AAN9GFH0_9CAEN
MTSVAAPAEFKPGVPDWSTLHQSSGGLASPVNDAAAWKSYEWPEERVQQFNKDGFVSNVPVLTEEQCDRLLNDYRFFMGKENHPGMAMMYEYHSNQSADPQNVLMHALGHWRLTQLFHDLVFLPQVVVPVSQCMGGKAVRFWHDQLFAKPAHHGGNVAWHQDYSYWIRSRPMCHMTVHIALEDQTEENGTLKYIPGSHRWTRNNGEPLPVLDFNFKDMEGIKTILTEEEREAFKPVSALLKKGEASFHHALSVHGSYGNRSPKNRRAAVLNYFADGTYSDSDQELLKGVTIPKGQKMEGQFFPIVFDPSWTKQ